MTDTTIAHIIEKNGGNFTPIEFLAYREKLDRQIIEEVVRSRNWWGVKYQITSAYRETGSHFTGKSIDFIPWVEWKQSQPDWREVWLRLSSWPFLGFGMYADWDDAEIGCHVDTIRKERQRPLRWVRVEGLYYYQSFTDGQFRHESGKTVKLREVFG
jgi:hypothetical protein